ncbi:hypothetical protein ABZU93_33445, partial [Micromonospora zamorensis]
MVSGVLANVVSNLASDLLSGLAASVLGPTSIALAVGGIVGFVVYEVRRRRADREVDPEPTDVLTAPSTGAPTLPYTAEFTGREDHVEAVLGLLAREHAVAVLGRRAVGTSACAVQAANLCRDDFPDGQYYLDLRRRGRAHSARQVLTALARILGTAPPVSGRPDALVAAADALRGQLDGRRILLVLDNVDRPEQVWPLLPPTARTCRLLLAGGPALVGLKGVVAHWIAEPGTSEAVELFAAAGGAAPAA